MELVLGIDTSNYTTSLCAVAADTGKLVSEARQLLPVKPGQRGLRQSDALFFHVQQLPVVMDRLVSGIRVQGKSPIRWKAVGVSVRPRPFSESYMPVFSAGQSFADAFGRALGVSVLRTSHQEGHLAAASHFLAMDVVDSFIGIHLSGGTSDVVLAKATRFGYAIHPVAQGADLHAGQFVDRVGVALGLPFPTGPHLERLAASVTEELVTLRFPSRLVQGMLSFSGPCTAALKAIHEGEARAHVALAVQTSIANAVAKAAVHALRIHSDVKDCVIAGGVAANQYIRERVRHRLRMEVPAVSVWFAPPDYSSDNALGVAKIAWNFFLKPGL